MDNAQLEQDQWDETLGKLTKEQKLQMVDELMKLPPQKKAPGSEEPGATGP